MRHIFSALVKTMFICVCASSFVACDNLENIVLFKSVGDPKLFQSDVDFDVDEKTIDIEVDMSEELSLTVLQVTLFAYLDTPLYRYLDASEFPSAEASICQNSDDAEAVFASFSSSKNSGESYQTGDTVDVEFNNCQLSSGQEVSGSLRMRYSEIAGVNDTFLPIDTQYCVDRLISLNAEADYDVVYVVGDEVRFSPFGSNTTVKTYEYTYEVDTGARIDTLRSTHLIADDQPTLVINERLNKEDGALASLDGGDEVYLAFEDEQVLERCQYYRRVLDVEIDDLSLKSGVMTTTMRGTIELSNISEDLNTESFSIVDSDLSLSVQENTSFNEFTLRGFDAEKTETQSIGTYTIGFSGLLSSSAVGGVVELDAMSKNNRFKGNIGEYPTGGVFKTLGQGLERVTLSAEPNSLKVSVDYDGDDSRSGFSVADETFFTNWSQLLARDFQRDDFVLEE